MKNATGREGKFEACIPGNHGNSRSPLQRAYLNPYSLFTRSLLFLRQLNGLTPEISLLHMNCEGCEWEMLESLLKNADVIDKVFKARIRFHK